MIKTLNRYLIIENGFELEFNSLDFVDKYMHAAYIFISATYKHISPVDIFTYQMRPKCLSPKIINIAPRYNLIADAKISVTTSRVTYKKYGALKSLITDAPVLTGFVL
jgi:hypothetical protein